jgi:hypothetical protein
MNCVTLQVVQLMPLLWLLASVVYCYDGTLPKPVLRPDGSVVQQSTRSSKHKTS